MSLLYQAQKYVNQLGWSVIPIKRETKLPALESWKEYQSHLPTTKQLEDWFTVSNAYNLAIVTGTISGLTVIDADSQIGINGLIEKRIHSPIAVLTGRGKHLYFRTNQNIPNAVKIFPDVDIRGEGGYVIAPPSVHSSGKLYQWLGNSLSSSSLPELPEEVKRLLENKEEGPKNEKGWISKALEGLTNGNRNDTFAKIAGSLHDGRKSVDDIFAILKPYCSLANFSEGELINVIRSVVKYPREQSERAEREYTIYSPDKHWELFSERIERKSSFQGPEMATGFPKLDNLLFGLRRSEVYTIGARTGVGKTTFCLNIASELCKQSKRVLYLSTEMSFDTIWSRFISINANVKASDIDTGRIKLSEFGHFRQLPFYVADIGNPSIGQIKRMIQEIQPDVVILDHIQHLGDAMTARANELSALVKSFKDLSREFNVVFMCASQLNRTAESTNIKTGEKVKPALYHLKECGSIEEESTVVILLNKEHVIDDTHDMYIMNVAKNRYGLTGQYELSFDKSSTRMIEA